MVGLGLKILGMGLAGSAITYGAYIGIREDMKWKASTDYPTYYWNKKYSDTDNVMIKYGEEEKWKFLYNYRKLSFWWKKENSKDTEMATQNVTKEEIEKAKNKVSSSNNALDDLLSSVDHNWSNKKDEVKFSNLSEEWKKYRELCIVILREFVMNSQNNWKSTLKDKCLFDVSTKNNFESFKSQNTDYASISSDENYWEKITKFKTSSSK